ncbi:hypothetical protein [Komagataeibacter melaceti]|uniref:hypothetical protein n=1 Tax=Komagataeibacter melaceti TaxID=2766577 RepID=UPI001642BB3C|nr:hypothetical protein [Komagataeibacter melaceti]
MAGRTGVSRRFTPTARTAPAQGNHACDALLLAHDGTDAIGTGMVWAAGLHESG